ncbi:MAG: TrkA family potassium uptake protein [Chloroflexi bacterium]|nr:TrkA family potassium uptake protein [Chloroflexota bacterium]
MNVLIMGCGRLGARVATLLDQQGHQLTVMDTNPASFRRLPESFGGTRFIGNGMDGPALERAGIREVDAFLAVTQGDNRNYFASQMAREVYGVKRVLCRIYDPVREEIFRELGLETFSPTSLGAGIMVDMLLKPAKG